MSCIDDSPTTNESDLWDYSEHNITDYEFPESAPPTFLERTEEILYKWVILVIVIFGIAGNLLNLTVLTSKSLSKSMGRMEMSAHIGLVALAVSDLMFCVVVLPKSFLPVEVQFNSDTGSPSFVLVYNVYGDAVINVFETSSTWLTVSMAFSRYMAICHPFKARLFVGRTFARVNVFVVFLVSIVFNLPRFFMRYISRICRDGEYRYFMSYSTRMQKWSHGYDWCHFIAGIVLPLVFMAFFNFFLIKEVRAAPTKIQRQSTTRESKRKDNATHLLTLTLTLIVVLYILLVSPAEFNNFVAHMITIESEKVQSVYNFSVTVTNTLKTLNFAINFILYCSVNAHFRNVIRDLFCCRKNKKLGSQQSVQQTEYSRVTERQYQLLPDKNNQHINSSCV